MTRQMKLISFEDCEEIMRKRQEETTCLLCYDSGILGIDNTLPCCNRQLCQQCLFNWILIGENKYFSCPSCETHLHRNRTFA